MSKYGIKFYSHIADCTLSIWLFRRPCLAFKYAQDFRSTLEKKSLEYDFE